MCGNNNETGGENEPFTGAPRNVLCVREKWGMEGEFEAIRSPTKSEKRSCRLKFPP
jgi:hypothetical protein